jgi:hypothetical protein
MNYKDFTLVVILLLIFNFSNAQNAEKQINRLVGELNQEWIKSIGETIPANQIEYSFRAAQGFKGTSPEARKQAILNNEWFFYRNTVDEAKPEPIKVQIPHQFERNRKYNSAWYLSKYNIGKQTGKRYFLKLSRVDLLCAIYVNGQKCGSHIGSYTPFELDITEELISGDNVFAIFVYDKSAAVDGNKLITQVGPTYLNAGKQGFNLSGGIDDVPILEMREKNYIKDIFVKTSTRKNEIEIEYELSGSISTTVDKLSFEVLKWPKGEKVELDIPEVKIDNISEGVHSVKAKWANPDLWSPDHPNLYVLRTTLQNGNSKDILETRFGFREFWIDGKSFMLNGVPTRLRGESHYRVLKHGVDLHREEFKLYKEIFGSNVCRVHAMMPHGDIMLGADEAGILLIDQSAVWSVNGQLYAKGGDELSHNLEQEFEEWVRRDRNCPSVVIWDVENEMLRFNFELHLPWVSKLPGFIKKIDNTRPINYSGAGWFSPEQDMVSLHMQDNYARIMSDWQKKDTRPLITGEFWVGARADYRLPSAPEINSVLDRYMEEAATYERNTLEMRYFGISGFMPFQISKLRTNMISDLKVGYNGIPLDSLEKAQRMQDVFKKIKHALQPVTVFFWPRETYCDAGQPFRRELVVCNDSENIGNFKVEWKWSNQSFTSQNVELKPGEQHKIIVENTPPKEATSIIALIRRDEVILSADTICIQPIQQVKQRSTQTLQIFGDSQLAKKLSDEGYNAYADKNIPKVDEKRLWIIPELANNRELEALKSEILNYLNEGGNILCLKQEQMPTWFPVRFQFWSASLVHLHTYEAMGWSGLNKDLRYAKYVTILAASHPVFKGIETPNLHLWNKFDGRVADDAYVRPGDVGKYEQGNWRPLVASAKNTQMSLAEIFYGKGRLLACQLHVIDNLKNPQAKRLFDNMLNYLSESNTKGLNGTVALSGKQTAEDISEITGANKQFLNDKNAKIMLAFDGADKTEIKNHAARGGTVIVLSEKVSAEFDGVRVTFENANPIVASKVYNHPLLMGISSGNFKETITRGYFKSVPENAKVLLKGFLGESYFWNIKEAGPVMISIPHKKGEIILTTINVDKSNVHSKEFLRQLLTNSGVPVPCAEFSVEVAVIKKTVPIHVDGKLDEWLDDMDDRNVSQYVHAQPIFLTSQQTLEGPASFDLKLSGINYLLWNKDALHIAGVIFSEEKTAMSAINYGAKKEYQQQIYFNDDIVEISFKDDNPKLLVNGKNDETIQIKTSQLNSKLMTDATRLQFSYINGGGEITTVPDLVGETFELLIPWGLISSKPNVENANVLINLSSKGSKLQVPLTGDPSVKKTWLNVLYDQKGK